MARRPEVNSGPAVLLFALVLAGAVGGCNARVDEEGRARCRTAMRSAASDLLTLKLDRQALELMEDAHGLYPTMEEAREIARLWEVAFHPGDAGMSIERLYPRPRALEVDRLLLDLRLRGWQWPEARALLEGMGDEILLAALHDLSSRSKQIRELFGRRHALSWRGRGCEALDVTDFLCLRPLGSGSSSGGPSGYFTRLGWNGRAFRLSADILIRQLKKGALLYWGIAPCSSAAGGGPDLEGRGLLVGIEGGRLSLHRGEGEVGEVDRRRWFVPRGKWLTFVMEYQPVHPDMPPALMESLGMVKVWIDEAPDGERLLSLAYSPGSPFDGGPMVAGFFSGKETSWSEGDFELCLDNFSFDN